MPAPRVPGSAALSRDVLLIAVVVTFAVLPFPDELFRASGGELVAALLPAAAMPIRRRLPFVALGVSLGCALVLAMVGVVSPSALLAAAFSSYAVIDRYGRLAGWLTVLATAAVVFLSDGLALRGDMFDSTALQFVLFVLLAGALGDAARSRRAFVAVMTERAERAEKSREEEARRRVIEERVRIARDLHDVVAHQISVISLNAGVASSALEARPERAREALTAIRSAARTVLTDIGGLMSLLRSDDTGSSADLAPQHGLADLDALIARFSAAGLVVELRRSVEPAALSPASDHVAYLVLQEGLTNAHKHGSGGSAVVTLRTDDDALILAVANPVASLDTGASPSGHGLRGLRERVSAVRGEVSTGPTDGGFQLTVRIPANDRRVPA
jgi:signal transduction histidine kinase